MPLTDVHKGCHHILAMAGKSLSVFANASAAVPACGLLCENGQRLPDLKSCLAFTFWSGLTPPLCRTAALTPPLSYHGLTAVSSSGPWDQVPRSRAGRSENQDLTRMPLTDAHKGCHHILAMVGKSLSVFANASAAVPACGLLCENAQRLPDLKGCLAFVFWVGGENP